MLGGSAPNVLGGSATATARGVATASARNNLDSASVDSIEDLGRLLAENADLDRLVTKVHLHVCLMCVCAESIRTMKSICRARRAAAHSSEPWLTLTSLWRPRCARRSSIWP